MTEAGYNLFTFDYRGDRVLRRLNPSQKGLNDDAVAAIRFVMNRKPALKSPDVVLYGESLGGAVLLAFQDLKDLKERARVLGALVVDSTFYSYKSIARAKLASNWLHV